jgi:SAM-dependent methyltransferase
MEKKEYEILYNIEDEYWWFVGLRDLVFSSLVEFEANIRKNSRVLDAGCGTGAVLERLKDYGEAYGIDLSEEAIRFCKLRGLRNVIKASITDIPCVNDFFNVVTSLDVLYHMQVEDDLTALKELYRVLKDRGILILNLPAYNFLRSRHDEAIHTSHRDLRSEVRKKVEKAGFHIAKITYRNSFLFPIFLIIRLLEKPKKRKNAKSDLRSLPDFLNRLLIKILFFENGLLNKVNLPFGLSIFCVAKKEERRKKR